MRFEMLITSSSEAMLYFSALLKSITRYLIKVLNILITISLDYTGQTCFQNVYATKAKIISF
jgi:hypothetical protein